MIDLNPLCQALISLIAALITVCLIPWLRARTSSEQEARIAAAVHIAVYAAEKLYGAGHGEQKLVYATEWLRARGFNLAPDALTAQINAAILEMEAWDAPIEIETEE